MLALLLTIALAADAPPATAKQMAPEFPTGLSWLNTPKALTLAELRGKVVLLDFWTYGCLNCMHVIPELRQLDEKFAGEPFIILGVHSGKFDNEKDEANIRAAVQRNGIAHPVIVDSDFAVWNDYAVQAWPTLILIGPDGMIIGGTTGEGHEPALERFIRTALEEGKKAGTLRKSTIAQGTELAKEARTVLAFPGKILAAGGRLFISDSNHNRIVVSAPDGHVQHIYGTGAAGHADGLKATFNHPQGVALAGEILYVADTQNHLLRAIDLKAHTVTTVAGNGERGSRDAHGPALKAGLASPWDVVAIGHVLYIANAGSHQLLALDLETHTLSVAAGSGQEEHKDGKGEAAALAQPSGLTSDGKVVYFADSEVSSVRSFDPATGEVSTLVGLGLFDFGDVDGSGDKVRLQHPLGVTWSDGGLFVADTYNHKIKRLLDKTSSTFVGTGKSGTALGVKAQLFEPGGLSAAGGKIYVADTNNSRIVVIDEKTKEATALTLHFPG